MLDVKLDIQRFTGGDSGTDWSAGITKSAVDQAVANFTQEIDECEEAIRNWGSVDAALIEGWSGTDRDQYLEKFHKHAENVCSQIEEYKTAVLAQAESIKEQWDTFQAGLIK